MSTAGNSQFKISMLFSAIDQLSPELKKMDEEVKKFKDDVSGTGGGAAGATPKIKKMGDEVKKIKEQLKSGGGNGGFKFFADMQKGLKTTTDLLENLEKKFDKMKTSGFGNLLTGGAVIAPLFGAVKSAGELQTTMITISGATGANSQEMADIKKSVDAATQVNRYDPNQIASLDAILATSGMNAKQVAELTSVMSKFAEVQQFGKHASPEEAVTQAISSAHMLGIYDPGHLDAYLDKFNKATFLTPGSTSEFFDTFKYLAPTAKGMGMSNEDVLYTAALANRVGLLGSMGGTESADMILRSIPGIFGGEGHVDKNGKFKAGKPLQAMINLGLANANGSSVFFDSNGQFKGIKNFIDQLSEHSKGVNPEQLMKDYKNMFGMQGERLAVILGERGGEQLQTIQQQMDNMLSMTDMQEKYFEGSEGQLAKLENNLKQFNIALGTELLPTFTEWVHAASPYIQSATKWVEVHGQEVEKIAKVTAEFGAFLIVLGGAKIAFGTIGSLVIDPIIKGVKSLTTVLDVFKKESTIKKSLPEQAISANIVNVYGKAVNGAGMGGGQVLEPGGGKGKGKPVILDSRGRPITSTVAGEGTVLAEEAVQAAKSGMFKRGLQTGGKLLKGAASRGGVMLPVSLALGAYDVAAAPEGHKVETAMKATGTTLGGWAGVEAGAALGAALGSVVPGVGTAIGGALGAVAGGIAGSVLAEHLTDAAINWFKGGKKDIPQEDVVDSKRARYALRQTAAAAQMTQTTYNDNRTQTFHVQADDTDKAVQILKDADQNGNISRRHFMMANSNG